MVQPAHMVLTDKMHLPTLDKAPTGGGTNALGLLGHSWSGPREQEAQETQTLPGCESFTVTTSDEWHPNELSSSSFSEHYNTTLASPSQQSSRCIKTQLDCRRCFTLRSLFPAAEFFLKSEGEASKKQFPFGNISLLSGGT